MSADANNVVRLVDHSDDCRTQTVRAMLAETLADIDALDQADAGPVAAVLVLRYSDGDIGTTEVLSAGVDYLKQLGLLASAVLTAHALASVEE